MNQWRIEGKPLRRHTDEGDPAENWHRDHEEALPYDIGAIDLARLCLQYDYEEE